MLEKKWVILGLFALYRRKLRNEELPNFYALPNIIRAIKSRSMRWAGHVARM